jgi:hypothetical protein
MRLLPTRRCHGYDVQLTQMWYRQSHGLGVPPPAPLWGSVMGYFLQAPFTLHARHQVSLSLFVYHII